VLAVAGVLLAWPPAPPPDAPPVTTWGDLLAPLAPGSAVAGEFVVGPLRRGQEHDVVLVATKRGSREVVEVHVVDKGQWAGVLETASFGVAYELPRCTATRDESLAVTRAVWAAVSHHDPGRLVVDAVPLARGSSPVPLEGQAWRAWAAGCAIALATALLSTVPWGGVWASVWLLALGLLLRVPRLGLPFALDQDVQRMFTGHLPLWQIVTGKGLDDRHPPLYFVVLHVAQWAGQSEAVGRAPAVIAGALVAPAIVAGAWVAARAKGPQVALAALAAAVSPELVLRSREVSEIPLFELLAIAFCASYAAAMGAGSRRRRPWVAASGALALYTYYLAPLVLAGTLAAGWLARQTSRRAMRSLAAAAALGAPAIALQLRIFLRDQGAREAARAHPSFAWGEHGVSEALRLLAGTAIDALGAPMLAIFGAVTLAALLRRRAPTLVPAFALAATFAGIALVAPLARVQPYYLVAVLPLALLAIAVGVPRAGPPAWLAAAAIGACCVAFAVPGLRAARVTHDRSPEEFMSELARVIDERPERVVALTADYDATLLAYDLARRHDLPMDWARMRWEGPTLHLDGLPQTLEPLLRVHQPADDPDGEAQRLLADATRRGDVLVVVRDGLGLDGLYARLDQCELVADAPPARLLACRRSGP
jgi:hypothetical protein